MTSPPAASAPSPTVDEGRAQPVAPEFALGQVVRYIDRQGRRQSGEVLAIEASWRRSNRDPLVQYTLRHPTYAGRRFYCTAIGGGMLA